MPSGPRYAARMVRNKPTRALLMAAAVSVGVPYAIEPQHAASAQEGSITREEARGLFDEALALEAAGDYTTALDKLQKAATYKRTPNIRYNIALCYEKLGRLVQALGEYRIALADAEADAAGSNVAKEIRRAIAALEPRIPTISIDGGESSVGATVTVDGKSVTAAEMAEGVVVDPGKRVVEAQMAGFKPFRQELDVAEGAREKVTIQLEKAEKPAVAPPAQPQQPENPAPTSETPVPTEPSGASTTATVGWVVTGLGVVSLGASGYFYARRSKAISDLEAVCGADKQSCPASSRTTYDGGKTDTLIGNTTLGVGAAALITGIILVVSGNASSSDQPGAPWVSKTIHVTTSPPGSWAGLGVDGRF